MRIERDAENSFTIAARPTLSPSNWLLRFVSIQRDQGQAGDEYLCIADAMANEGRPVLLTFTEVASSPDATDAEITLAPGQYQLYVYEQTSTTNLNYTLCERVGTIAHGTYQGVFATLVEVVGDAAGEVEPTNPCAGSGSSLFDVQTIVNGVSEPLIEDVDASVDNTINMNITVS